MPKLQTLELEIKQTISNSRSNSLEKLAQQLETLRNVVSGDYKGLREVADSVGYLAESTEKIQNAPNNVKKLAGALESLIKKSAGSENAAKGLWQVAVSLEKIADASERVQAVKSAMQNLRGAIVKPSDIMNLKKVQEAEAKTAVEQPVSALPDNKAYLKSIDYAEQKTNHFSNAIHKAISAGKSLVGLGWDKLKSKISGLIGPVTNLIHSFGRIAMYRALRTAIKAITQGFSEGIKHLYHWSEIVGNEFKNSMDSLTTSAHYLRDSLGAMASPLIDALAPAIEALVEKFVSLLNVVNQFIATITGQDSWRRAVRTATEYDDGIKDATDSAKKATAAQKKLNKALQDFDELNLITTSTTKGTNPSGGSGGSGSGIDSTHFVEEPIADWIKDIKNKINEGDWAGAGTLLAEKLNGMVSEWKAQEFGNKIGEKFQKGLDFYLAFMKKFEWENLGTKIGAMFNGIFETMSAEDLGHALVAHIKAGVKLAKGFLEEAEPAFQALGVAVSTAINDFFDPDFAVEFGETIAAGVNDAITFLKTLIVGSEKILQNYDTGETITVKVGGIDFKQVGESLMTSIFTAIKTINWADLGETMAGLFTGIIDAIGAGISYAATHISEIAGAIKDFAVAFFERMWEWFWPTFFEIITGGPDYQYQGGDANDRPNAPTSTGQGAKTMEGFNQEVTEATDWLTERWKWLDEHNPLNLDVTDTGNTINTQSSNVQGLNDELDHTDGTFTSEFKTKELQNRLKAVNPYAQLIDDIDGKQTSTFATSKLDEKKNAVTPYSNMIAAIGKKITTTFAVSNYKDTYDKVKALNDQLAATGKAWKITVTADLRLKPHSGSYYTIEPMAEGGFPTQGSLFVAGEVPNSTEMVGNINGKTGVASGREITGIADAVRDTGATEADLLRQQNQLLRQLLAKSGSVTLAPTAAAGKWVAQSQAAYARATGG